MTNPAEYDRDASEGPYTIRSEQSVQDTARYNSHMGMVARAQGLCWTDRFAVPTSRHKAVAAESLQVPRS